MTPNPQSTPPDYTVQLRQRMQAVGITSLRGLYEATGMSRGQVARLRQGQVQTLPVAALMVLSRVLQTPLTELLAQFDPDRGNLSAAGVQDRQALTTLREEYQRLVAQQSQVEQAAAQTCQHQVLQVLESLLLQWPTAAYAAQNNPQAPAVKLLPLLRPLETLLQLWQIEAIGQVGAEVAFDPRWHQVMAGEAVAAGEPVRVRYVGYRQGEQLLHRAKVSPLG